MNTALQWFKSSHSTEQGGNCLEVAYDLGKSSYSTDEGGAIHVRDSKNPAGPTLTLAPTAWTAFTAYAAGAAN
ncbi:DUF397 domain-containing protein [Streptomyces scopuliridis]|uniref:DUF397 domain-containing protein n=1 Tax=Streptomyces scopuliridis TaxID=452529 RepID=UPI00341663FD